MSDDFIPRAMGASVTLAFFEGQLEPVIILNFHHTDEEGNPTPDSQIAIHGDDMEASMPTLIAGVVRARTMAEMLTMYPEKRDEIVANLMFRWTGEIVSDEQAAE